MLLLEIFTEKAKSRFLQGILDTKLEPIANHHFEQFPVDAFSYLNLEHPHFHILDKIISFDATQQNIFQLHPPLIVIGSAGSGKTMLILEKMKTYPGNILYVTGSPYLVHNARQLYYAQHYENDGQEIDFLSYHELLETIQVPPGAKINFQRFARWLHTVNPRGAIQDANKLYEEFQGVLTGNRLDAAYLSKDHYLNLGVKQSIYRQEERSLIYDLFQNYLTFLKQQQLYDTNLISYEYLTACEAQYDFVVVDEVQDLTPVQLALILKKLKYPQQFLLCGDSNQIVHPNFFSWAKIKSLFYQQPREQHSDILRVLNKNYRNAPAVTSLANKLLKIKNARFGSVDKESHYLVESQNSHSGAVYCLLDHEVIRQEINDKTRKSTHFAVLVLHEDLKEQAARYFQTPLIFSIYEAKGLEYDNVILYHFISSEERNFREIAQGVSTADLESAFTYGRVRDKTDRSLEIYKFFVNALYVAITRAIKNVYLIETLDQHPLLNLLGLTLTARLVAIESQESSPEEWQKEARRLEMQGKQAQAEAIQSRLLQTKPVPWPVVTYDYLISLRERALNKVHKDKEARLLLFEYALHYHQLKPMIELAAVGFAPVQKSKKDYSLLERKYFMGYSSSSTHLVMSQVALYGVNFRTPFNQTPLMVACHFGNPILAKQLLDKGANPDLTDNACRTAFQIALHKAVGDKRFAKEKFLLFYEYFSPQSMGLQLNNKLLKLDGQRIEFFLINAIMAIQQLSLQSEEGIRIFQVSDFVEILTPFPEIILPEKRKRRAYLSGILARHEMNRNDIYNKKLFVRVKRGHYVLNPELVIKAGEQWFHPYLFWFHHHYQFSGRIPKVELDEIVSNKEQLQIRVSNEAYSGKAILQL